MNITNQDAFEIGHAPSLNKQTVSHDHVPSPQAPSPQASEFAPQPFRILVVEDDITLKKAIIRSLKKLDQSIEVEWATSADQFLSGQSKSRRRGNKTFDLVLADINMPGVNSGFEVWNHFALLDREIPVVIMSGLSEGDFKRVIGDSVPIHYMQKPLNLEKCAAVLELCA